MKIKEGEKLPVSEFFYLDNEGAEILQVSGRCGATLLWHGAVRQLNDSTQCRLTYLIKVLATVSGEIQWAPQSRSGAVHDSPGRTPLRSDVVLSHGCQLPSPLTAMLPFPTCALASVACFCPNPKRISLVVEPREHCSAHPV